MGTRWPGVSRPELEERVLSCCAGAGSELEFGGKYFALDARVIRLPRHGASCPIGIGVSCSADRNVKARIDRAGLWIEELETNPERFIPQEYRAGLDQEHAAQSGSTAP